MTILYLLAFQKDQLQLKPPMEAQAAERELKTEAQPLSGHKDLEALEHREVRQYKQVLCGV